MADEKEAKKRGVVAVDVEKLSVRGQVTGHLLEDIKRLEEAARVEGHILLLIAFAKPIPDPPPAKTFTLEGFLVVSPNLPADTVFMVVGDSIRVWKERLQQ